MTIAQKALGIATTSPYPQSFDGSGFLFWFALFSMIVIPSLSAMLGIMLGKHLIVDRSRGFDVVAALRVVVLAICVTAMLRCIPEVSYMIAYSEASPLVLQRILIVKRAAESFTLATVIFWIAVFRAYYPEIILKLRSPLSTVWNDHKLIAMKRFASVVFLAAAFAASATIGIAFR